MKIVIQAVPERKQLVEGLLGFLPDAEVYYDEKHEGCHPSRVHILRNNPQGVLILQDDVVITPWFLEEAQKAVRLDDLTSFCLCTNPWTMDAYQQGFSYVRTKCLLWGQAIWMPAKMIREYLKWLSSESYLTALAAREEGVRSSLRMFSRGVQMDDQTIRRFLQESQWWNYVTLPNLVNHRFVASTLGHTGALRNGAWVSHVFGKSCFVNGIGAR